MEFSKCRKFAIYQYPARLVDVEADSPWEAAAPAVLPDSRAILPGSCDDLFGPARFFLILPNCSNKKLFISIKLATTVSFEHCFTSRRNQRWECRDFIRKSDARFVSE